MSFTEGQLIFALSFFALFAVAMIIAYRKDIQQTRFHSGGAWKVVIAVIAVFVLFYSLVKWLA